MKNKSTVNIFALAKFSTCFTSEEMLADSWHRKSWNQRWNQRWNQSWDMASIWDWHCHQDAATAFDDCHDECLNKSEALMTKAKALSDMGKYEEAAAAYDLAIEATPHHFTIDIAIASAEMGKALEMAGKHDQALKAFKRALKLSPEDRETWHYKGLALRSLGHCSEVNMVLAMVCELSHQQ